MATTFNLFDQYRNFLANPARAVAVSGTLKMALFKSFAPDQNLDDFYNDLVAGTNEVVGTGYAAGGATCASPTWTGPDGAGLLTADAGDPALWIQSPTGFTNARRAIVYYDTTVASTSRLVAFSNDFGADLGNVSGDVQVSFSPVGLYTAAR